MYVIEFDYRWVLHFESLWMCTCHTLSGLTNDWGTKRCYDNQNSNSQHRHFDDEHGQNGNVTMDIEEKEASNCFSLTIIEDDALKIMSLLMKRGYFHDNVTPIRSDAMQINSGVTTSPYPKEDALFIETSNQSYIMIDLLREKFMEELQTRGRLMIADAAEVFHVSSELLLRRVVPFVLDQNQQCDKYITTTTSSGHIKEIVLNTHFQEVTKQLFRSLKDTMENGWMLVSDAAKTIYKLPLDVTVTQLEKFVSHNQKDSKDVRILLMENASKVLVTTNYWESIKQKLGQTLGDDCDSPIDLRTLTKSNAWEWNWVLQIIQEGLDVPGEFHGDMYVPDRYVATKRHVVTTSYGTNGYVTSHMCYKMLDVSPSQMKEYITSHILDDSYVILPNSVVRKDTIVTPLLESAFDASESQHWLDLQLHIPIELLEYETNDVQILVDTYILTKVNGVACVRPDGALLFSDSMIQQYEKYRLVSIVKNFGIARAKELFISYRDSDSKSQSDQLELNETNLSGKEKRSNRKSTKASLDEGIETMLQERGTFPFQQLVQSLMEDYPDLQELESSTDLLTEICKLAFYTDAVEGSWCGAIQTELLRLQNDSKSSRSLCVIGNDNYLNGFQSIENAFEDPSCFASCCYMIQAKAKFVSYAMECTEVSDDMKQAIQRDFFAGCCRDFAYRVTQFALYRNKVADGIVSFSVDGDDQENFYSPIDICSNSYNIVHFTSTSNRRELHTVLKDELPPGIGISLAQTWDFCDSGSNGSMSNSASDASVNDFLEHLRDNCLTFCGLPFAIYDKKAEKKFLATRRSQLMDRLEKANNLSDALDFTIMSLYQVVKNLVVSGPLLQGSILQMLLTERKLPESAAEEICTLVSTADQDITFDSSVIERLRKLISSKTKK